MRLGAYSAHLAAGSRVRELYDTDIIQERHRHRYEVNPDYHTVLKQYGLHLSGLSSDGKLVEFIEISDHPFFIATQAHPELKSRLDAPHPLFHGFIKASIDRKESVK